MEITPRPYQNKVINPVVATLIEELKALLVMATGLGKTLTSAWIVEKLGQGPGLFLAHNNDILDEAKRDFRRVFPNPKFGTFDGQLRDVKNAEIVFASVQSMERNLHQFKPGQFKWLVLDEGHHAPARTFKKVIDHFKCKKLAITATPNRMDLKNIREIFGSEIASISLEEAIVNNWLPKIEYNLVADTSLNEQNLKDIAKRVLENGERISIEKLKRRLFVKTREEEIASIIEGYDQKTIVFCKDISHADEFARLLRSSALYHSGQDRATNKASLDDFKNDRVKRICVVDAFNEGINVEDAGLVVFVRTTQSETVFKQQLGRGMRPGKEKLVVLDFAGNLARIKMVYRLVEEIERLKGDPEHNPTQMIVSGQGYEFTFSKEIIDIMEILKRLEKDFYPTWQEAAEATAKIGIKNSLDYKMRHKVDARLPSQPSKIYDDFPGFPAFFGRGRLIYNFFEARTVARKFKFKSCTEYFKGYKQDPRLPQNPAVFYPEFTSWSKFLGRKEKAFYATWQEASRAARKLGINSQNDYLRRYKLDKKLPASPRDHYGNFPGWKKFLGKKFLFRRQTEYYTNLDNFRKATKKLGINNSTQYKNNYHQDSRLPSRPDKIFSDWPGWLILSDY